MIRTRICDLLGIEHPIALGGMGSVYSPDLVAAVSNAATALIRERTNKPFARIARDAEVILRKTLPRELN